MAQPAFIIVDPSLKDFIGHHFAYDHAVADAAAAAGYAPAVLGHRNVEAALTSQMPVIPAFRRDIWDKHPLVARFAQLPGRKGAYARAVDDRLCGRDFWADLRRGLRRVDMPPGSIMLAHMITMKHLPAFAEGLGAIFRAGPGRSVILLLRYQAAFYENAACRQAFRRLEALARRGHAIRLASDSERLAGQLGRLTMLPVEVLPIPHPPPQSYASRTGGRLRFASLGNARDEKGFFEILQAIRILQAEPEGLEGLEFWLQSNHPAPDVRAAIEAFQVDQPPEVTMVHEGMDEPSYHAALLAADVVMVPYWRSIYEARTSGVFLEAIAAGKPVIATQDCWMSDELAHHGAGILVPDHDAFELARAIRRMAAEYPDFSSRAVADQPRVLARHSAAALVAQCAAPPPGSRRPPARRLAVFYPWDDVLANRGGASQRINMLLNLLSPKVELIEVLQQGQHPPESRGIIAVESAGRGDWHRFCERMVRVLTWPLLGRAGRGEELLLVYHLERLPALRFRRKVDEMVQRADAVLLEYSFHAPIVLRAARRHGKPVILSQYDVLSMQMRHSAWLRRLMLWLEVWALRRATHAISVSESDQAVFQAAGVATQVLPNPVDLARGQARLPLDPRRILAEAYGLVLPPGPIAIFVGSRFGPNIEAAGHVRRLARMCPHVGFVVAGQCMEPMTAGNFVALGTVEEAALIALYRAASLVLVPLESGSGSSLKTVEAMGAGLPVLGTPVAFRGLDVVAGEHCVIEPDLMRWPARITELLRDADAAARMGAAGQALASGLDYRVAFRPYAEMLGLQLDDAMAQDDLQALEASLTRQVAAAAAQRGAQCLLAELPPEARSEGYGTAGERIVLARARGALADLSSLHPALRDAVATAMARSRLHLALAHHLMAFEPPAEAEIESTLDRARDHRRRALEQLARESPPLRLVGDGRG